MQLKLGDIFKAVSLQIHLQSKVTLETVWLNVKIMPGCPGSDIISKVFEKRKHYTAILYFMWRKTPTAYYKYTKTWCQTVGISTQQFKETIRHKELTIFAHSYNYFLSSTHTNYIYGLKLSSNTVSRSDFENTVLCNVAATFEQSLTPIHVSVFAFFFFFFTWQEETNPSFWNKLLYFSYATT